MGARARGGAGGLVERRPGRQGRKAPRAEASPHPEPEHTVAAPSAGRASSAPSAAHAAALVGAVAIACYANTLPHGSFLYDDQYAVQENADVLPKTPLVDLFKHDFWGTDIWEEQSHKSYRPLTVLTFRWNYALHGFAPRGYHVANVLIHAAASVLFFRVCREQLLRSVPAALVAGLLFATHPVHTEAVANIVGRAEGLCAVFFLLSYLLFTRAARTGDTDWLLMGAAIASAVVSILCKETGITVFGIMVVHELLHVYPEAFLLRRGKDGRLHLPPRPFWVRLAAMVATVVCYVGMRRALFGTAFTRPFGHKENPVMHADSLTQMLSYPYLHVHYARLLVYPMDLSCDYSFNCIPLVESLSDPRNAATAGLYLFLAACVVYGLARRHARFLMGWAWIVVIFLPASQVFFHVGTVIGERLLYLPSFGFCVLLALAWERCSSRTLANAALAALLVGYSARTVVRNSDWDTEAALWTEAYRVCPQSVMAAYKHGSTLASRKQFDDAIPLFERAIALEPTFKNPYWQLGVANFVKGDKARAVELIERSIELGLTYNARIDLAIVHAMGTGQLSESLRLFQEALDLRPNGGNRSPSIHLNMGNVYVRLGDYPAAIDYYRRALAAFPAASDFHNNLGACFLKMGDHARAVDEFRLALRRPDSPTIYHTNMRAAQDRLANGAGASPGYKPKFVYLFDGVGTMFAE